MNIFLSWSGDKSRAIAEALRDWLPDVIQSLKPWMSKEDIAKGAKWDAEIAQYLKTCPMGIICLTTDNLTAPWLLFEAGALSNNVETKEISGQNVILGRTTVCTYLYELTPTQVKEPLSKFQATEAKKDDTKRLLQTINNMLGQNGLSDKQLSNAFERCWTALEHALDHVPKKQSAFKPQRSTDDMLAEILTLVRNLSDWRQEIRLSTKLSNLRNLLTHSDVKPQNALSWLAIKELAEANKVSPDSMSDAVRKFLSDVNKDEKDLPATEKE